MNLTNKLNCNIELRNKFMFRGREKKEKSIQKILTNLAGKENFHQNVEKNSRDSFRKVQQFST